MDLLALRSIKVAPCPFRQRKEQGKSLSSYARQSYLLISLLFRTFAASLKGRADIQEEDPAIIGFKP